MLEYVDADFEDIFMQTFRVSYQDVFGSVIFYDLKQNADEINVTQENKRVSIIMFVSSVTIFNAFILFIFIRNLWICMQISY